MPGGAVAGQPSGPPRGMVGNGWEIVNLRESHRSTIGLEVARWLRARSPQLSWGRRWSFACVSARCIYCGGRGDLGAIDLCEACLMSLPWLPPPPPHGACRAVFAYQSPIDEDLRALKFRGDLRPARVLGALCAAVIDLAGASPQGIVPVPLHAQRLRERGFNQTNRLARQWAAWLGIPVHERWLLRCRATAAQTSLSAVDRRRNVQGAFTLSPQGFGALALARPRLLLLDDVLTTGATLQAACSAFGAAAEVQCWTVAMAMPMKMTRPT